ncbi:hypothetical protein SAMN04490240_0723 [Rhodococcus pyridinivorans]|uniref:hypothetical protein n=1 Tax=Rhodococcus pyridinivorans TaxID=103816 RepID=UPI000899137F|nr:hypothetical protein [Rhodococcus pyridinivorans]SEB91062.1 hypothetical protein SAMN04490240_0723 [Rhodococcus pyridinivorans]
MTYRRKTVDPVADNNDLTDTDLAAVVEALTGEPFDHAEPDSNPRAPRRDARR